MYRHTIGNLQSSGKIDEDTFDECFIFGKRTAAF